MIISYLLLADFWQNLTITSAILVYKQSHLEHDMLAEVLVVDSSGQVEQGFERLPTRSIRSALLWLGKILELNYTKDKLWIYVIYG